MDGYLKHILCHGANVRQGCPISALLYIFVAKNVSLKINNNTNIQGLKLEDIGHEIKNIQHTDD